MAYVFLRLKRETEALGRGHIILPPSAATTALGWTDSYWQDFYDGVHYGVYAGTGYQSGITPTDLRSIHIHHYSRIPFDQWASNPIESVAYSATLIRRGVQWYRDRYNSGNPLPLDILLSEMGLDWTIDQEHFRRAGGWDSFKERINLVELIPLLVNTKGTSRMRPSVTPHTSRLFA